VLPPPVPPPIAEVTASLHDGAGAWAKTYDLGASPAALATPCFERALEVDRDLAGWLWIEARVGPDRATTRIVDSSPLPASLTSCIADAFRVLRAPDGIFDVMPFLVYVSLATSRRGS
jgi:hypothetical protein